MFESVRILLPVAVTLIAPLFIWIFRRDIYKREAVSLVAGAVTFLCVLSFAPAVLDGQIMTYKVFTIMEGISVTFAVDGLGIIFALVASFLWMFATSYNIGYMRGLNEHAQTRYYFCFAVAIFGAVGVSFAANVFTLYLFYEVITVFTYPLVAHHEDADAWSGARKYIVYLMGTSKLFLLPAMVLTYVLCGTLDMHLGDIVTGMFPPEVVAEHPTLVTVTYVLYIAGLAKAALMPFHNWLPSAMVAPTPVSALLHAVAVVKAGVFSMSRVMRLGLRREPAGQGSLSHRMAGRRADELGHHRRPTSGRLHHRRGLDHRPVQGRPKGPAGLFHGLPALLRHHRRGHAHAAGGARAASCTSPHHAFSKITLFYGRWRHLRRHAHQGASACMHGMGRRMPWTFGAFAVASLSP